ncbi:MAG: hypothetical protein HY559_02945 [Gammaproteobacteria bacterium]|nr:hypothetical protein [Gammaproteobacteria bacterium]
MHPILKTAVKFVLLCIFLNGHAFAEDIPKDKLYDLIVYIVTPAGRCSGIFISPSSALTAESCFVPLKSNKPIKKGITFQINEKFKTSDREDIKTVTFFENLALVSFRKEFTKPIPIVISSKPPSPGEQTTVAWYDMGWDEQKESPSDYATLSKALKTLNKTSFDETEWFRFQVPITGAPLLSYKNNTFQLYGIVGVKKEIHAISKTFASKFASRTTTPPISFTVLTRDTPTELRSQKIEELFFRTVRGQMDYWNQYADFFYQPALQRSLDASLTHGNFQNEIGFASSEEDKNYLGATTPQKMYAVIQTKNDIDIIINPRIMGDSRDRWTIDNEKAYFSDTHYNLASTILSALTTALLGEGKKNISPSLQLLYPYDAKGELSVFHQPYPQTRGTHKKDVKYTNRYQAFDRLYLADIKRAKKKYPLLFKNTQDVHISLYMADTYQGETVYYDTVVQRQGDSIKDFNPKGRLWVNGGDKIVIKDFTLENLGSQDASVEVFWALASLYSPLSRRDLLIPLLNKSEKSTHHNLPAFQSTFIANELDQSVLTIPPGIKPGNYILSAMIRSMGDDVVLKNDQSWRGFPDILVTQ